MESGVHGEVVVAVEPDVEHVLVLRAKSLSMIVRPRTCIHAYLEGMVAIVFMEEHPHR